MRPLLVSVCVFSRKLPSIRSRLFELHNRKLVYYGMAWFCFVRKTPDKVKSGDGKTPFSQILNGTSVVQKAKESCRYIWQVGKFLISWLFFHRVVASANYCSRLLVLDSEVQFFIPFRNRRSPTYLVTRLFPTFFPGKNEVCRSHIFSSFVFGPGAGRPSRVPLAFLPPRGAGGRRRLIVQIEEDRLERQGGRIVSGHGEGARKKRSCFVSPAIRETICVGLFLLVPPPARAECFDWAPVPRSLANCRQVNWAVAFSCY